MTLTIFGAFLDCELKFNDLEHSYHGSMESFVFRFEFGRKKYSIFEYHHTGSEPYILQCDHNGITVGKGESPALFIDHNLIRGSTMECMTFRNDLLSPRATNSKELKQHVFRIKDMEIWCPTLDFSLLNAEQ